MLSRFPRSFATTTSIRLQAQLFSTCMTTNFSAVYFLANSTPINLSGNEPILKHINDFINNMRPSQRSSSTSAASEMIHLSNRGRASTLPTTPTSSASPFQPSSATTTSSSFRQHQCDQLLHLRRQHSSNIRDHPSQRAQRFNIVPLLVCAHRNRQLNLDKVPSTSRLHRARTIIRFNSGTNIRMVLPQQHHPGRLNLNTQLLARDIHVDLTNRQREEQANSSIILFNINIEVAQLNAATYGSTTTSPEAETTATAVGQLDIVNLIVRQLIYIGNEQHRCSLPSGGVEQLHPNMTSVAQGQQRKIGRKQGPCTSWSSWSSYHHDQLTVIVFIVTTSEAFGTLLFDKNSKTQSLLTFLQSRPRMLTKLIFSLTSQNL